MCDNKRIDSLTEKEKKQIIRVGTANDNMNKYCIKISVPSFCVGTVLIILSGFRMEDNGKVILLGIGFLLCGCFIPMIWAISVAIRGKICKNYSYELYEELVGKVEPKSQDFEPDFELYPLTTKLANEMFEGDIKSAIEHVMMYIRGDELSQYIAEWSPAQARYAMNSIFELGQKTLGEKEVKNIIKENIALSEFAEDMNMDMDTAEETLIEQKNPYVKKLIIHAIVLVVLVALTVLLAVIVSNLDNDTVNTIASCIFTIVGASEVSVVSLLIVKAIKFQVLKKKLKNK